MRRTALEEAFAMTIRIGINGACGRMGQAVLRAARQDNEFQVGAALEASGHPHLGRDGGEVAGLGALGIPVRDHLEAGSTPDVVVDFSSPAGTMAILPICLAARVPMVVATTGHSRDSRAALEAASSQTAILLAANTSLGISVLTGLVRRAAESLRVHGFDIEIVERHHRFKQDAPSGTALHLAHVIQEATGAARLRHGRQGIMGERSADEIGLHAIRGGDNPGSHTVIFTTLGETLELTHCAHTRDCYARGALQAAKFLVGRPPGQYTMDQVLGLD